MRLRSLFALLAASLLVLPASAQRFLELLQDDTSSLESVRAAFNSHWQDRPYERGKGYKVFKRWEWFMEQRAYPTGERPDPRKLQRAVKDMHHMVNLQGAKSNADWQPLGPYTWLNGGTGYNPGNGRVNCMAVDPFNSSIIYAGTPAGGLWKSTDNGQTWNALFTDLPTLGVSGIAIDHSNSDIVYCATGDGDGNDMYAMGVIKSTDGGDTWASTGLDWNTTAARTTRTLRMHPWDPAILICATSNGLWKTEDGGNVWAQVAEGSFHDVEFKPDDPGIVYACGDRFFRSLDGGSNFSLITAGLPAASEVNRMRIAVTPADGFRVYVLCGSEADGGFLGLYRSTDGGSQFVLRSSAPNIFGYDDFGTDSGGQSNYDMALTADPVNANTIWAGGINVWKSTNGGTDWSNQSSWFYNGTQPYTHADIHSLDAIGNTLYCGSDGGLFRSTNGGDDWTDLSEGLQITQFYRMGGSAADPASIIAGAQDNGMNFLAADQWTHVLGADGMEGAIDPSDPTYVYGESQNGGINRSDDGGLNFYNIMPNTTEEGAWVTPFVIDQQQPNVIIAGYNNLWRSEDRGDNWEQWTNYNTQRTVRAIAIAPGNSTVVYFANDNSMRRTTNNGGAWQVVSTGLPDAAITSIAVDPADPLTVWVSLSAYSEGEKVYRSNNGGDSWTNISGNLPNVPANTIVTAGGTEQGVYVGTDIGVFYTDNTLSNWQPFSQGLPRTIVNELEINQGAQKLRAATFGRGLWETDLYVPVNAPPTATFTFSDQGICAGDAIVFHDASLNAAPGWSWSFPGGSPATSTEANPAVTYAQAGSYTATLTVNNAFGTDDFSTVVPVTILPNLININLTLDDYPGETSWTITNDLTGQDVASSAPYSGLNPGSTIADHLCLDEGCYTFTINDSYGDGICCDNGTGLYTVTNPELGVVASGGEFNNNESTSFCVSLSVGLAQAATSPTLDVIPLDDEGRFALTLDGIDGPFDLLVSDALGREIRTRSGLLLVQRKVLDLSNEPAGLYFVRIRSQDRDRVARLWRR